LNIDLEYLKSLAKLACEFNLTEINLSEGENQIVIKKEIQTVLPQTISMPMPTPVTVTEIETKQEEKTSKVEEAVQSPKGTPVIAPIGGTFYRSPSPGAEPYCSVGKRIEVGDVLCIIESMKLMNEIETEIAGVVVEICVKDAEPVETGTILMYIE